MELMRLTSDLHEEYRIFLESQEGALLYHGLKFKSFLEDLLGCRPEYWVVRKQARIIGVLPLMEQSGPWGNVLNSLPYYGSNGGILAETPEHQATLFGHYRQLLSADDVLSATLIEHPLFPADTDRVPHTLTDHRIGQFTPLVSDQNGGNYENLLARFEGSARRNINKASLPQLAFEPNVLWGRVSAPDCPNVMHENFGFKF